MSVLRYRGVSPGGNEVTGRFVGGREALIQQLRQDGVVLTDLRTDEHELRGGRYSFRDFSSNIEQLAYLVDSEVPVDQAIALLVRGAEKESVRRFWETALEHLRGGAQASQAIRHAAEDARYPLSPYYVSMLAVGEETGNLKGALQQILENTEFQNRVSREIRSAMAYPAFLTVSSFAAILFVFGFVLPRFAALYSVEEMAQLPAISRYTLQAGAAISEHMLLVVGALGAAVAGLVWLVRQPDGQRLLRRAAYRTPVLRELAVEIELADLFSALGAMLKGGVDLSHALRLSRRVVNHPELAALMEETEDGVKRGRMLSQLWEQHRLIPQEVIPLITVGERTARLDHIFERSGLKHMETFRNRVTTALTFLEPAVIAVLGAFVAVVVISIVLAVLSMNSLYA
jgi:general secretion pathway protein F